MTRPGAIPQLGKAEIEAELLRVLTEDGRASLVALFGRGEAGQVHAAGRSFTVTPTRSEMELRAWLPEGEDRRPGPGRVFLIDWARELPGELGVRLATGRMRHVGREKIGRRGEATPQKAPPAPLPNLETCSLEDLVAFCVTAPGGPLMKRAGGSELAERSSMVRRRFGSVGNAAWRSWLDESGPDMLRWAVLLHACSAEWGPGSYGQSVVERELRKPGCSFGPSLLRARRELEKDGGWLLDLLRRLRWGRSDLEAAEALVDGAKLSPEFRAALTGGRVVTPPQRASQQRFWQSIGELAGAPSAAKLSQTRGEMDPQGLSAPEQQLREMALRVSAWLCGPPQVAAAGSLAGWYGAEGCHLDRALRYLRSAAARGDKPGLEALHRAASARRRGLDERFDKERKVEIGSALSLERLQDAVAAPLAAEAPVDVVFLLRTRPAALPQLVSQIGWPVIGDRFPPLIWRPNSVPPELAGPGLTSHVHHAGVQIPGPLAEHLNACASAGRRVLLVSLPKPGDGALASSLATMVLITRPGTEQDAHIPSWWNFEPPALHRASAIARPAPPPMPKKVAPAPAAPPEPKPAPETPPAAAAPPASLVDQLQASPVFAAQAEPLDPARLPALLAIFEVLVSAGGQLSTAEFAERAAVPLFRVSGPVLELSRLLNVDGYPVISHDAAAKQVRLDLALLAQVFEVTP